MGNPSEKKATTVEADIDRQAVVRRHTIELRRPDPELAVSVGNGDFAYTADITGMQTFTAFHDPAEAVARAMASGAEGASAAFAAQPVLATSTMSTWGWHEMPNPDGFTLDDAMTEYQTARGPVKYPDRYDTVAAVNGTVDEASRAGAWLHVNPQRIDLGRIGLELRAHPGSEPETDPSTITDAVQTLDLWTGILDSRFLYRGEEIRVRTVAAPDSSTVAFRIQSALLADGRAQVALKFPYASDTFFGTAEWNAADRHSTTLSAGTDHAVIERCLDATTYWVRARATGGEVSATGEPHVLRVSASGSALDLVVRFEPEAHNGALPSFDAVEQASTESWERFWLSGAALDLAGSADPRAAELERRVVLSQYLTRVHSAGVQPPQETGLVVNSWQGKFHLEMHFWHAAHFAAWGRPELLARSFDWYASILPIARETAMRQGYRGARWPKQVAPDGRESPSEIGSLLVWQQPHLLYLLELAYNASDESGRTLLMDRYAHLADETAEFLADFPEERDGKLHLGAPVMPAQEFYDARTTSDPTFELAYWWWGLEIGQRWRERRGLGRKSDWEVVQHSLVHPYQIDGRYLAVATSDELRRDDHPSLLAALGVVPATPLIDPTVMEATLLDVLKTWEWPSAWGWDFPMIAMTAARLGLRDLAIDALLRPEAKNRYSAVGHNPQIGALLPLYLPGNGSLLAAVALLAGDAAVEASPSLPDGWTMRAERFPTWPGPSLM
jgi:hypothetical protein